MLEGDEKRHFARKQAAFSIQYCVKGPLSAMNEFGASERSAIASNLSEGGLQLFSDLELTPGTMLSLKFRLLSDVGNSPEERSRKLDLQGEVLYSSHAVAKATFVAGVQFFHLSDNDRAYITDATS